MTQVSTSRFKSNLQLDFKSNGHWKLINRQLIFNLKFLTSLSELSWQWQIWNTTESSIKISVHSSNMIFTLKQIWLWLGIQMCETTLTKKKKKRKTEYKILVGENYAKFIQTSPAVLRIQSFYDNKSYLKTFPAPFSAPSSFNYTVP